MKRNVQRLTFTALRDSAELHVAPRLLHDVKIESLEIRTTSAPPRLLSLPGTAQWFQLQGYENRGIRCKPQLGQVLFLEGQGDDLAEIRHRLVESLPLRYRVEVGTFCDIATGLEVDDCLNVLGSAP
jgi:hypothetical protein